MAGPTGGPIQGKQLYKQKPGGKVYTKINWTGSPGASDGLRANIEYDDCHQVNVEVTFLFQIKNNPSSSTDKDHYSLKMGSHGSDSETSALYEDPTGYGGGNPSLRVEAPHHGSYHGCSGAQTFKVPAIPINNTKTVGLKFVRWNIGTSTVHTEWYYDFTGAGQGPWQKAAVFDDSGSGKCGVPPIGLNGCIPGSPNGALQQTLRLNGGDFDLKPTGGGTGGSMVEIIPGTADPGGPTPPPSPQPDGTLKFYLSSGSATSNVNTNPNNSLGGQITTTEVVPNAMDNMFDDVGHNISQPETNYRLVYVKNTDGARTFTNPRCYLQETDNFIGIRAGLSGAANTPEQVLQDEETGPDGGFASIYNVPFDATQWAVNIGQVGEMPDPNDAKKTINKKVIQASMTFRWASAKVKGQHLARITLWLSQEGSPAGNFHVYLRDASDNIIGEFGPPTGTPVASIVEHIGPDAYQPYTFDADDNIKNHEIAIFEEITVNFVAPNELDRLHVAYYATDDEDAQPGVLWPDNWIGKPLIEGGYSVSGWWDVDPNFETHAVAEFGGNMFIDAPACFSNVAAKPTTYDTGVVLPNIPPNGYVAVWLVRTVAKEAPDSADTHAAIVVEGKWSS